MSARPPTIPVVLRRTNGRFVKQYNAASKYDAKRRKLVWEAQYDSSYKVEIGVPAPEAQQRSENV
jgi:hypothetical protein